MRRSLVAAGVISVACVALGAGTCNPPKPTPAPFEIRRGGQLQLGVQFTPFNGVPLRGPGEIAPVGILPLTGIPGRPANDHLSVQFQTSFREQRLTARDGRTVVLSTQAEAQLFARDPTEAFRTLTAIRNDPTEWETSIRTPHAHPPWMLPDVAVVPFPAIGLDTSRPIVLNPVTTSNFFKTGPETNWGGPGIRPGTSGSIKALRVVQRGLCSREVALTSTLYDLGGAFTRDFLAGTCRYPPENKGARGYVNYLNTVAFLRGDPQVDEGQEIGGFHFSTNVLLADNGAFHPTGTADDCQVHINAWFDFGLYDGRLGVAFRPGMFDYDRGLVLCAGAFGNPGLARRLWDGLNTTIPSKILETSTRAQLLRPQKDDEHGRNPWACGGPEDSCALAKGALKLAATDGAAFLGITDQKAIVRMHTAIEAPTNWRCADYSSPVDACTEAPPIAKHRCEFIIRAKRLNVQPDVLELVWFDDLTDYDNPNVAVFFAAFRPENGKVDFEAYRELCTRTNRGTNAATPDDVENNYFVRRWASLASVTRAECPTTLPPRQSPFCPCDRDAACRRGVKCDTKKGACAGMCLQDTDCPAHQQCEENICVNIQACVNRFCLGKKYDCDPHNVCRLRRCTVNQGCQPGLICGPFGFCREP